MFRLSAAVCVAAITISIAHAEDLPDPEKVKAVELFTVPAYCEGVVFDYEGNGYVSWDKTITKFKLDGKHEVWAETGAPNGHKIFKDGTHGVCDASQHAVLRLSAKGELMKPWSTECKGVPLRGPNDMTRTSFSNEFFFTDPGDSDDKNPIGTVHFVDAHGITHLIDEGLAYPNGIVWTPDGRRLYVAESKRNRILVYDVNENNALHVGKRKLFAELPEKDASAGQIDNQPDGMCLDAAGNLYVAHYGMKQVQVLSREGKLIARYAGGNVTTSNVAFGGPDGNQLFVTGGLKAEAGKGGVFRLDLGVEGFSVLVLLR